MGKFHCLPKEPYDKTLYLFALQHFLSEKTEFMGVNMSDYSKEMNAIRWSLNGTEIESESFKAIEQEIQNTALATLPEPEWRVARRLIHTTADMHIADTLKFRHNPIESGIEAMRNAAPIICDSKMIRSGLSMDKLKKINPAYNEQSLICGISDPDVIEQAKKEGRTRALCSAEKARPKLDGAIVLIGNAPLALARFAQYVLEENVKPALVIGMPVGFVNVVESKELLAKCEIPQVVLEGRRGGSALAVTTLHAIMENIL